MLLLTPVRIASVEVRNRLVFGPHETNLGDGRAIGSRHVAYYRRRARGGSGLIITEVASVHDSDWPYERAPLAEDCSNGWAQVAEACAQHGTLTVAALGHAGLQGSSAYHQRELWAPSRVADAVTRELPKEMEPADIEAVLTGFEQAARLARSAGCAGVEVNAGQHSLVRQFLSGLTNMRGDEWGPGDDGDGRLRFARQALGRARAGVGDGLLGLRLSCDELAPWAGLTPESAAAVAAELAAQVDYIAVVRGSIFSVDATRPDAHTDAGFNLDLVRDIRAAVPDHVSVVAQGSLVDPGQAEWAIEDGRAELVEMTRAQIAEPDLARRLGSGGSPRPCIRCNQRCRVRDARNPIVSCVVNPSAGFEDSEPELAPQSTDLRRFAVVGAGPAGLEFARVAATAGHDVLVHDAADECGSTVRNWTHAAGRGPLVAAVDWLEEQCRELGVGFELGIELDAAAVNALDVAGTEVVLCTGSRSGRIEYELDDGASRRDALGLLAGLRAGDDTPTGRVVVWDPVGGPIGISVAETLAPHATVILVTPDVIAGNQLALTGDLASASTRLLQAGVEIVKRHVVRAVARGSVDLEDRFTGEGHAIACDLLIDAGHRLPDDGLWRRTGERHFRAGDAVAPRTMYEAVLEGRRLAIARSTAAPRPEVLA